MLDSTVFVASEPFYEANWSDYRYRPAEARRLLEQAGCRRGVDAIYACAGEKLSLRFLTTAGVPYRQRTLDLIQSQLRRVGVEVIPNYVPPGVVSNQLLRSGAFDAVLFAWNVDPGGAPMPESICKDPNNVAGYCSRLVMRDVQQTDQIVDPRQRARVLNAADAKLARAVPVLPLYQPPFRVAHRTVLRGVVARGGIFNFSQNNEDWWLER